MKAWIPWADVSVTDFSPVGRNFIAPDGNLGVMRFAY